MNIVYDIVGLHVLFVLFCFFAWETQCILPLNRCNHLSSTVNYQYTKITLVKPS